MSGNHNMYCSGNQPDIVQRLREQGVKHPQQIGDWRNEAADEIESLRQQLEAAQMEVSSMKDHVRAVVSDLAECERERDDRASPEMTMMLKATIATVTAERDELRDAMYALAKLGADKGE